MQANMFEWHEIDTNTIQGRDALNILIAEAQGYTIDKKTLPMGIEVIYIRDSSGRGEQLPDYATDVNEAMILLEGKQTVITTPGKSFMVDMQSNGGHRHHIEVADTLSLAICYAYLNYRSENG